MPWLPWASRAFTPRVARKSGRLAVGSVRRASQPNKKHGRGPRPGKLTEAALREVIRKIRAGESTVIAEAPQLGCYHATLRKQLRRLMGEAGYNQLVWKNRAGKSKRYASRRHPTAQVSSVLPFVFDPLARSTLSVRCNGDTMPSTDGIGFAVLICLRCGGRERVIPRRATA